MLYTTITLLAIDYYSTALSVLTILVLQHFHFLDSYILHVPSTNLSINLRNVIS